ncbi:HAT family dimerization domain-containing protein [Mycena venus]|uniref:HAT family dimerization domain-containing protein n=1 Tax=Mycena venus TaxID=2733690 RepID=A0A8H6Z406_9AGAR|nr:HAT family dimerization domain-containing protein [Mycena venus]
MDAIERDPIATLRAIVRQIRTSSLRRQFFSDILKSLKLKDLELLRDVVTRWSSTLLMIDRGLLLRPAIDDFLSSNQVEELRKFKLGDEEWKALEVFKKILDVPHAFQQKLSAEKTPMLCHALPAFEAMIKKWEQMQLENPETADIIQQGLDKLGSYQERLERVPAYTLAMIVNPRIKLRWLSQYWPEKLEWAKQLFKNALKEYDNNPIDSPARRPTYDSWADEILGLEDPGLHGNSGSSINDEVNEYLTDPRFGLGKSTSLS